MRIVCRACRHDACRIEVDEPDGTQRTGSARTAGLDDEMRGLDVAVHDAECVERSEADRRLREQRPRLRLRQPLPRDAPLLERMAADIFLDNDRLVRILRAEEDLRPERRHCPWMLA